MGRRGGEQMTGPWDFDLGLTLTAVGCNDTRLAGEEARAEHTSYSREHTPSRGGRFMNRGVNRVQCATFRECGPLTVIIPTAEMQQRRGGSCDIDIDIGIPRNAHSDSCEK